MNKTFSMTMAISFLLLATACSETNGLSGGSDEKKEAKKSKPQDTNTSPDATQPQVVTGAYLSCVQDSIPDIRAGENGYGCGIYDTQTQAKIDLTNRVFKLSIVDNSGQPMGSRTTDVLQTTSPYQRYFYAIGESSSSRITGVLTGSKGEILFSSEIHPIRVGSLSDGLNLKSNYSPAEISAWCGLVTALPDNLQSTQTAVSKGIACGAQYLCRHNYSGSLVTCIAGMVSSFSGNSPGICTETDVLNYAVYSQRCSQ